MSISNAVRRALVTSAFGLSLALLPATGALASPASPVSYVDSAYNFYLGSKGATDGTPWRSKDNATSTYIKVSSNWGKSPRLYVDGANDSNGRNTTNCTNKGSVRAPGTGEYEIHNGVYELGFRWARITSWADLGPGGLKGVWSPDCRGNYADLN